jgi:hypothetical protein
MPNIMTQAEAAYAAAYNDFMAARAGFYAGTVSAADFIALKNEMERLAAEWEADRLAA